MTQKTWPKARKDKLSITTVGDETIVFDRQSNKASCLNAVTTTVWQACDGNSDIAVLLEALRTSGIQDASKDTVLMALNLLGQAELLDTPSEISNTNIKSPGRREMLRSLGKSAAIAIPMLSTIEIQPALAAGSCSIPCGSGFCCPPNTCVGGVCVP